MDKSKNKVRKAHALKCTDLSYKFLEKYELEGFATDGGMTKNLLEALGDDPAEETIDLMGNICKVLLEVYEGDAKFKKHFDARLKEEDFFGENVSPRNGILTMKFFFEDAFNLYTPSYLEMFRLRTNPELFSDDDLAYLEDKFLNT